jgi:hypothetical protein
METNATVWQSAILQISSAEDAMKKAGSTWDKLKKDFA